MSNSYSLGIMANQLEALGQIRIIFVQVIID